MPDLVFATKGTAEVIRQQTLVNERAAELASIYKADERAAIDLERAASRIFKNARDPAKQFNEEMGKLLGNYKQGKINAEQYAKGVTRLEEAYKNTQTVSGKLARQIDSMFGDGQLKKLASFAAGVVSIQSAISLLKSEYAAAQELADRTSRTQLDVGQSRNLVIRNLVGTPDAEIKKILGQTAGIASELRLPETSINQAFAQAISASGGDVKRSLSSVRFAGQFLPDQLEQLPTFAGALLDLAKVTGSTDDRVNFGLLAKVQQLSRVKDAGSLARNAPKGLIGAAALGASAQEAGATYATISSFLGDQEGSQSSTVLVQLIKQIMDSRAGQSAGARTFSQRLAFLQSNPAAAQEFLAKASFESASIGQMRDLVGNPQSLIAQSLRANFGQVPGNAGLASLAGQTLGSFKANEFNPLAEASRGIRSIVEQFMLQNGGNILPREDAEAIKTLYQQTGSSNVGAGFRAFATQLQDGKVGVSIQEARNVIAQEAARLSSPVTVPTPSGGVTVPRSEQETRMADALEKIRISLDKQLEQLQKMDKTMRDGGFVAGGE